MRYRHIDVMNGLPFTKIFAAVTGRTAGFSTSLRFGRNDDFVVLSSRATTNAGCPIHAPALSADEWDIHAEARTVLLSWRY